ncbi:hypothetical protein V2J09_002246 [Rumex salicifolius]
MDSSLTAVGVVSYFIQQYYRILQETPEIAYQFYKDESAVTRVLSDSEELNASSVLDIHSVLTSLNYTGIEILSLKCQDSLNGSILAIVSGSVKSRNFNGWRKFTQVFLLAPQDHGYFVLNDIFEYGVEASVSQQPQVPEIPEVKVEPEIQKSAYTEEPDSSYALEEETREYVSSIHIEEDYPVDKYSLPDEHQHEEPEAETEVEEAPVEEFTLPDSDANTVQDSTPAPVNEYTGEPSRFTYASILFAKSAALPQQPVRQNVRPSSENRKVQTTAAPVHPSVTSSVAEAVVTRVDESFPQEEGEPTSVYVRNLPSNVTTEDLEMEFKHFGKIKPNGIFIRNRKEVGVCFGFVEFEDLVSVHNAVKASPIHLLGRPIYVEERRASSAGVARGGGAAARGRGRGRSTYNNRARGNGFQQRGYE